MATPTVSIVVADSLLAVGETSTVTFTFSEAVTGFANADLTVPNGTLSSVTTLDGGVTFTATLTPSAGVEDAANLIAVDNTGYANAGLLAGVGTTNSNSYAVDTLAPSVVIDVDDSDLGPGETATVTVTFSEEVDGFLDANLNVPNGVLSSFTTSDHIIYTATFTPTASLTDPMNVITLNRSAMEDLAGNAGAGLATSNNFAIDTAGGAPAINLPGTVGADAIAGNIQSNMIVAGDGDDSVTAAAGDDTAQGGAGADFLQGNAGSDSLEGGAGVDTVLGGQGDDYLNGNAEDDWVSGDKGSDIVLGGSGDDTAGGGVGDDYVSGDAGDDQVSGDNGDDAVMGGLGDDFVYGGLGDDVLSGDKGADVVRGGQGADQVQGGDGDDWLSGDKGSDTVTGGAGADVFHGSKDTGTDLITDFNLAQGDKVLLDAGVTYTLAQVGADTVVSMTGGAQMILQGVQLSTLTPGWILTG